MKKIALIFALLFCGILPAQPIAVFSQVVNKQIEWTRIESPTGDMSFSVPAGFLIDNEDGEYRVIAYQNEVLIRVAIEKSGDAKKRIKTMRQYRSQTESKISNFELGDFIGDVHINEKDDHFSFYAYAASSKAYYSISASTKAPVNSLLTEFLNSIRLGDQPLLKQEVQSIKQEEAKFSIASFKTSPTILEALKKKPAEITKLKYELISKANSDNKENTQPSIKYSRPLIILRKPYASYTDDARQSGVSGTVKLRFTFRATGEISDITILKKLHRGLDRNAVDAVRNIKFLPAEIDGKPVDEFKTIEYSFTIY